MRKFSSTIILALLPAFLILLKPSFPSASVQSGSITEKTKTIFDIASLDPLHRSGIERLVNKVLETEEKNTEVERSSEKLSPDDIHIFEHKIRPGESLNHLRHRHGIRLGTIYSLNPKLREGRFIRDGTGIFISNVDGQLAIARKGDTLRSITDRYDGPEVDIAEVRDVNRLIGDLKIDSGTGLFIPGARMSSEEVYDRTRWNFQAPVRGGRISSCFSFHRVLYVRGRRQARPHYGVDIALATGSPVRAARRGTVTYAGWKGGYGKAVIIRHLDGIQTLYGHLSKIHVKKRQRVSHDQMIGRVGSTGNSTGPHLHLEYRKRGKPLNPLRFIRGFSQRKGLRRCR